MSQPQLAPRAHSSRAQLATRTSADPHAQAHRPDSASRRPVVAFLRGKHAPTDQVKVGLHRIFVDRGLVGRILVAYNSGAALARHVDPRIADPRALVRDPHFGWEATATVIKSSDAEAAALEHVRQTLLGEVRSAQAEHAEMTGWGADWSSHMVADVSDRASSNGLPGLDMWEPALTPLGRAWAALHSKVDLQVAREQLHVAALATVACEQRFSTYRADTIDGAEKSVLRLRRVQTTCDAINVMLGAGAAAGGAKLLVQRGIVMAARSGAEAAAAQSVRAAVGAGITGGASVLVHGAVEHEESHRRGLAKDLDVKGLLLDTGLAVATNAANALLAGVLAARFSSALGGVIASKMGPEAVLAFMEREGLATLESAIAELGCWKKLAALAGSHAASLLTGAVNAAIARLREDPAAATTQNLIDIVVTELVGNGIATLLFG